MKSNWQGLKQGGRPKTGLPPLPPPFLVVPAGSTTRNGNRRRLAPPCPGSQPQSLPECPGQAGPGLLSRVRAERCRNACDSETELPRKNPPGMISLWANVNQDRTTLATFLPSADKRRYRVLVLFLFYTYSYKAFCCSIT